MTKTNSMFKKITSLLLSVVFVLTSFAVIDFSKSTAIEAEADETEHFLMAYFTGNDLTEQQVRLAVSTDGFNFKPLNGGNAILQEKSSDTHSYTDPAGDEPQTYTRTDGVRDPYIFDGHDGYYYCIATDLDDMAYAWWGNQPQMVLWRSSDLVNWTDAKYINIAQLVNEKTGTTYRNDNFCRVWAPEVYYEDGTYYIHFAIGANSGYNSTTMYYMSTDDMWDLSHYNVPQQLYRPADDPDHPTQTGDAIDATIVKQDGVYYMIYKDENAANAVLVKGNSPTGPYHYVGKLDTGSDGAGAVEGNEIYTVGDKYYFVADRYSDNGLFAVYELGDDLSEITADGNKIINMTDGNPIRRISLNGYENLTPRHGSFLHISTEEYNRLCNAYGGVTNDDIMYNFTTSFEQNGGWNYRGYSDSSLFDGIDIMTQSGGYSYVPHDSGYITLKKANIFVNNENVRSMILDDVYTISFDYSLENTTNLNAPIFALGQGNDSDTGAKDFVMIFGNGDMWVRKSGESDDTKVGNKSLQLGVTYHYDIVSDGTNITFYRDGEQIGKIAATIDFPNNRVRYAAFGYTDGHSDAGQGYGTYSHIRFRDKAVDAGVLSYEFNKTLLYQKDDGTETVSGKSGVLNVSSSTHNNTNEAFISKNASSYSISGWVNPGSTINNNAIFSICRDRWNPPKPYGRYFVITEKGEIHFNNSSGVNDGGNDAEHYVDITGTSIFSDKLAVNTWSFVQINMVPVDNTKVKLSVWVNGTKTYQSDINLKTHKNGSDIDANVYTYGFLGFMQLTTNRILLGYNGVPNWWMENSDTDTQYVKDVRVYAQAMDPDFLYETEQAEDFVKANINTYDVTAAGKTFTAAAYHASDIATNGYNNLVYSPIDTSYWNTCAYDTSGNRNQNNDCGRVWYLGYKIPMPQNSVMVYDGVSGHTPAIPVQLEFKRFESYGNYKTKVNKIYFAGTDINGTNSNKFELNNYWYGFGSNYLQWYGDVYDDSNYEAQGQDWKGKFGSKSNVSDFETTHDGTSSMFWWNSLHYKGSGDTTNFYEKYSTLTFAVNSVSSYNWNNWTTEHIQNEGANVYVLNYAPVYNALKYSDFTGVPKGDNGTQGQSIRALIMAFEQDPSAKELYTTSSVDHLYYAAYKLMNCNPNDYSYSSGVENAVKECASDINEAVQAFNSVNLELRADFSTLDSTYTSAQNTVATKGTDSQTKTNTSLDELDAYLDTLTYVPASKTDYDRADMSRNAYQSLINAEKSNIDSAVAALKNIANFSTLDTKYAEGDRVLKGLEGEKAIYNKTSVDTLITRVNEGSAYANTTIEQRRDMAADDYQDAIDDQATNINTAVNGLTPGTDSGQEIDLSAFYEALGQMENLDTDIYSRVVSGVDIADEAAVVEGMVSSPTASTYTDASSTSHSIKTLDNSLDNATVTSATTQALSKLTDHLIMYNITIDGNATATFSGSGTDTKTDDTHYTSTANNRAVFSANGDAATAWYMSYTGADGVTRRTKQYQGYGSSITLPVVGNMTVYAVQATENKPNRVTINRNLSDNPSTHGINSIDFAGSSYTLPAAPAIPYYTFTNYTCNGNTYAPGDTIEGIERNIVVSANYTASTENAYAVKVTGVGGEEGNKFNKSVKYNEKIEVSDASAYAWVETPTGGTGRIYYIGSDLTFFATDSVSIQAITETEYNTGITNGTYKVPSINLRAGGVEKTDMGSGRTKLTFNANYVNGSYNVVEYGILVGKATTGTITNDDLIVENTGTQTGYKVLRAKSTKLVGANQFTIGVNTNFTGAFKYRAYMIYQNGSKLTTVYSPVVDDSIATA